MPKIFCAGAVALAAFTSLTASAAAAEEYEILIMETAFFPEVTYVDVGDTVIFVNMSGESRMIKSENDEWFITAMAEGESATLAVTADTDTTFEAVQADVDSTDGSGGTSEEIGNGEDGAQTDDNVYDDGTESTDTSEIRVIGNLNFSDPQSAQAD